LTERELCFGNKNIKGQKKKEGRREQENPFENESI